MTKATDNSIMTTAIDLFKAQQFEQVTVNDICQACGITKPTFYYHFSNKDQLISRYFRGLVEQLPAKLRRQNGAQNPLERIYDFFQQTIQVIQTLGPDLYSQLYISNLKTNQHTFDFSEAINKYVTELISQAQASGLINNPASAVTLYRNSVFLFEGYEINWCFQKGEFDAFSATKQGLAVLFVTNDVKDTTD